VKRLGIALFLLVGLLVLGSVTGLTPALETLAGRVANKVVLYVNVARLYTKEPDRTLAMPLPVVTRNQISDTWHAPRGTDRLHQGQDIFAPRGTPILSATDGYIMRIGENSLGGQTVSVAGAGGRVYYYAHLDAYAPGITEGDYVTTRSVLGYVGTTGNAAGTPPHLHFGVYGSGGAINPLPLLTDRPQEKTTERKLPADRRGSERTN
jgi:murein DD-endopeptidase MepM/ murein hydrolase activator NlpD